MRLRRCCSVVLAVSTFALALTAAGQSSPSAPLQATVGPNNARTASAPSNATDKSAKVSHTAAREKSPVAYHQHRAKQKATTKTSHKSDQKASYQTALKRCVAGPADRRDSCLDDAIARYHRP